MDRKKPLISTFTDFPFVIPKGGPLPNHQDGVRAEVGENFMRKSLCFRLSILFALLITFLSSALGQNVSRNSERNGTLVVQMVWDDVEMTPTTGAYIEAHTFGAHGVSEKSFILKMVEAGRYQAELPPAVYDVFVSEASSTPRSRRVLVRAGQVGRWTLMLEHDEVYLER